MNSPADFIPPPPATYCYDSVEFPLWYKAMRDCFDSFVDGIFFDDMPDLVAVADLYDSGMPALPAALYSMQIHCDHDSVLKSVLRYDHSLFLKVMEA